MRQAMFHHRWLEALMPCVIWPESILTISLEQLLQDILKIEISNREPSFAYVLSPNFEVFLPEPSGPDKNKKTFEKWTQGI
jgi:hypothetical protein